MHRLTEINEEAVAVLVNTFYGKIRKDAELGPVFEAAIREEAWPVHLKTMCDFWSSVILKTGRYQGSPFLKHRALPVFPASLFDRWLVLFEETAAEIFETQKLSLPFVTAAHNIARSLKYGLYGQI